MELYDARKLINDGLLNGMLSENDLENEAFQFIRDHKLGGDTADEVINALSHHEESGRLQFLMPLDQMKFDSTAATTIKQLHIAHLRKVEFEASREMEAYYEQSLERLVHAIDDWREQTINRANGLSHIQHVAGKLLAKFELYERMLVDESKDAHERKKAINFTLYEERVREAGAAFIGRERKVRSACERYSEIVGLEIDLYLRSVRLDKGAELYRMLRTRIENILINCTQIRLKLEATLKSFEQLHLEKTASPSAESSFEHAVQFETEEYRPDIKPEDFVRWYRHEHGSLSLWFELSAEKIGNEVLAYVKESYRPLRPVD
jgi:hypothetical protein